MRPRLTVAGWWWLGYAIALAGFAVMLSGCAHQAAAPAAPRAGDVCALQLQGRTWRATVRGMAWGMVDVDTDAPGFPVALVAPAELIGCRA